MKLSKFVLSAGAVVASAAMLTACGGGGGGGTSGGGGGGSSAAVTGGYGGTLSDSANHTFDMLLMDDGTFWMLYGTTTNNVVGVSGFIRGSSTQDTTAMTFTSSGAMDFTQSKAVTVSGAYTTGTAPTITGTVDYDTATQPTFSSTLLAASIYDYTAAPALSDVVGSWDLGTFAGAGTRIAVAADGTFRGINDAGCTFTGAFTTDASGKNVFDSDITFGGGVCAQGSNEYKGIAIVTHANSATQVEMASIDVATQKIGLATTGTPLSGAGAGAAGGYGGTINDASSHKFDMIVMDDKSYWVMYGTTTGGYVSVSSFIHGTSTQDTALQTFDSADAQDFGLNLPATIAGNYDALSIGGTIDYTATNHPTFAGAPLAATLYNYTAAPNMADVTGSWSLSSLAGAGSRIAVSGTGAVQGINDAGCTFTGSLSKDASGKNVFDADLTFGGGVCPQGTNEYKGIAIVTHASNSKQLEMATIDVATGKIGLAGTGVPLNGVGDTAAGGYVGTLSDGTNRTFNMFVKTDGTYYIMYGPTTNGIVQVDSFIGGTSTQNTQLQTFDSTDAMDYGLNLSGTISGNYSPLSIDGTITYTGGAHPTFSGAPLATAVYNYSLPPSLPWLTGSWKMGSLTGAGSRIAVTVGANSDTFRGVDDTGCSYTGTFTKDSSGKNIFDMTLAFAGGTCTQGTASYSGAAFLMHVNGTLQLDVALNDDATHTHGLATVGVPESNSRSAAGGYAGTINDASSHQFDMIVMDDGTFWTMYGTATNGVVDVSSFIEGTITEDEGLETFQSTDAIDFGPQLPADIYGQYTTLNGGSIEGVIEYSGSNHPTFSGDGFFSAKYDYTATPVLTDLDGSWNMASLAGQGSHIQVTTTGNTANFTGSTTAGCNFIGAFTLDPSGKNVFDTDTTFQGGACTQGTAEYKGIAILTHVNSGNQLVMTGIDVLTHTLGIAATGHH